MLPPGSIGDPTIIKGTFFRLVIAGGMTLAGLAVIADDHSNVFGIALLGIGFVWGTILLFVLSAQLLLYGVSGILHDIKATQEHDPWNRW